jgi:uncharacterized protein
VTAPLPAHPQVGVGWAFPIRWDVGGAVATSVDERRVVQSMALLLRTRIGERVMRPRLGADADRFVFAPRTDEVLHQLEYAVDQALLRWEPRVIVDDVSALAAGDDRIDVSITYRLDAHRRPSNLVLPFYLEDGT